MCKQGLMVDLAKIAIIVNLPPPTSVKQYDFEVIVKPGRLNAGPDHLSRLESGEDPINLEECLPDVQLFSI